MTLVPVTGLGKGGVQLFQPSRFISCLIIMHYRNLHIQVSIKALGLETRTGMDWSAVSWQIRLAFHKLFLSSWPRKVLTESQHQHKERLIWKDTC